MVSMSSFILILSDSHRGCLIWVKFVKIPKQKFESNLNVIYCSLFSLFSLLFQPIRALVISKLYNKNIWRRAVLQGHWSKCYWLNKHLRSLGILKLNSKCPQQFTWFSWKNILLLVRLHVQIVIWYSIIITRKHGVALRAVAKLHLLSTPEFVARTISRNIAAVEFRPASATLRATNFFVYLPSAAFRANLWHKLQCSANQILNLTTDLKVSRRTFQKSLVTRSKVARRMFYMKHCAQNCTKYPGPLFSMEPFEHHQSEPNKQNTRDIVRNIARKNLWSGHTSKFIHWP